MEPNHDDGSVTCIICSLRFSSISNMMRHKRMSHGKQILYVCDSCGTTFRRLDNLKQHERKYHSASENVQNQQMACTEDSDHERFKCTECTALFLSPQDLEDHKRSHQTCIQTFVCHTCGRIFDDRKKFMKHSKGHGPTNCSLTAPSGKRQRQATSHYTSSSEYTVTLN